MSWLLWLSLLLIPLLTLLGPRGYLLGIPLAYHAHMFALLVRGVVLDRPADSVEEESVLHFAAAPLLCDWNLHMGNSMYNMLCDVRPNSLFFFVSFRFL